MPTAPRRWWLGRASSSKKPSGPRSLRQSAEVAERLAREARLRHHDQVAERLEQRAQERRRHLQALRELLVSSGQSDYLDPKGIAE